jgi:hypothetical protein
VAPELTKPQALHLDRATSLAAAVVAGLRQRVNDPIRRTERDRGRDRNFLNDLEGAIGELAATIRVVADMPAATLEANVVDFSGPVDGVDLNVRHGRDAVRPEAKALLVEPRKRWFLVNETACGRSARRGAAGTLSTITSVGAVIAWQRA